MKSQSETNNNYSSYMAHEEYQDGPSHDDNNQSNLDDFIDTREYGEQRANSSKVLLWCLVSTFTFSIIEAVGGYVTHSIALQSDALHMLTDAAGLFIAYLANIISKRHATVHLTFGYGNAEAVGALINCIFTSILTCMLLIEAMTRFFIPVKVHGYGLLIIAIAGGCINGTLAFVLSKYTHSLNTKAAFIHALGDLLGSVVAIVAGIIIYVSGFSLVDPLLSLLIIAILLMSNYRLIKKSIRVLMAGVPEHLDYVQIGKDIEDIEGIAAVHDLHVWYMSANKTALSAHIVARDIYGWQRSLLLCQKMLVSKYGIGHITLQYEFKPDYLNMNYCESQ